MQTGFRARHRHKWLCLIAATFIGQGPGDAAAADYFWTGGTGGWNVNGNWDQGLFPEAQYQEVGIINNSGVATVSTMVPDVAGLVLGQAAGDSGTLIVQSGGSINFIETNGSASQVAPIGVANIALDGDGLLEVHGGGSFSATSLDVNDTGEVRIGLTGAGAASVASTGNLFNDGVLQIRGDGHNVTVAGDAFFEGASRYYPTITSSTFTTIGVTGTASLGGTLRPMMSGYNPSVGDSWDLIDAAAITNGFAEVDLSSLPTLPTAQVYRAAVAAGGAGQVLRLSVDQVLTLQVDWDTKAVTLVNQGTAPVTLDSYSILSGLGVLNPSSFNSLDDQNVGGAGMWNEAGPTANALNELNPTSSFTVNGGQSYSLGAVFAPPASGEFGQSPEDLDFQYSTPSGEVFSGIVEYTGVRDTNNFRLTVDPVTGEAQLRNDGAVPIALDGYSIFSASGALLTSWSSLDDQELDGSGTWQEAAPTATEVSELNPLSATTVSPNGGFSIGALWDASGPRDLRLEFSLLGEATPREGSVIFGDLPPLLESLAGDFNADGVVNAADYTVWRDHLGDANEDALNGNGDGGDVSQSDYNLWRSQYGAVASSAPSAASAAPEPGALAGCLVAIGVWLRTPRRRSAG